MALLSDVNVLLALCDARHAQHATARLWIESLKEGNTVGVCRMAQMGLLRLLNNRAVMGKGALNAAEAWGIVDLLRSDVRFFFPDEPLRLEARLRRLTDGLGYVPKVWPDAYLAAFAIEARLRLVTFDRGFLQFPGLECLLLGRAGP